MQSSNQISVYSGFTPEQVTQLQARIREVFNKHFGPIPSTQDTPLSTQQSTQQTTLPQPITKQKKKRNQKTRLQYKRRSLQTVQEVEHSVEDSVQLEHLADQSEVSLSVEDVKQVALKKTAWWLAVATCWHAVIPWDEKKSPVGSTTNATGLTEMYRNGIG